MTAGDTDSRRSIASCSGEPLAPQSSSAIPVSAEYEKALVTVRVSRLEEETMSLLERVIALESENSRRNSSPPAFEASGPNGWRIRGSQLVGVVMTLAAAVSAIAYFFLRNR